MGGVQQRIYVLEMWEVAAVKAHLLGFRCPACETIYEVPDPTYQLLCACTLLETRISLHREAGDINSELYDYERTPKPTYCDRLHGKWKR